MKRKLLGVLVVLTLSIGYCRPCSRYGGYCQSEQPQGTVVRVNNHIRIIPLK